MKVTKHGAEIAVNVVLPDGRSTSRWVSRRDDIVPTVQALLLVPRASQADPEAPSSTAEVEPAAASAPVVASAAAPLAPRAFEEAPMAGARDRTPADPASSSVVKVELSLISGARIGDNQTSVGLGVLSFVDIRGWLGGFSGRADYSQGSVGGPPGAAFSLTLLGGRRLRFGSLALDLYGGPGMTLQGTYTSVNETPSTGRHVEESGGHGVPRVLAGAKLNFRARSVLRTFVGIDGDFGARGDGDGPTGEDHQLPIWSLGLAVGATVGTL